MLVTLQALLTGRVHRPTLGSIAIATLTVARLCSLTCLCGESGRYYHCAFYLIAILAGPALLGFPYSMIGLTWSGGVIAYLVATCIFIFCNVLVAKVHQRINERDGVRYFRYRDLTGAVFGTQPLDLQILNVTYPVTTLAVIPRALSVKCACIKRHL